MTASTQLTVAIIALVLLAFPRLVPAQQPCVSPVALFESVKNSVQVVQASTRTSVRAVRLVLVCPGDRVQVGDNSRAVILMLASNTPLVIDQNSEFVITERAVGGGSMIDLLRGALLFITHVRRAIEIQTPFVNAAVEGTEFVVRVQPDQTVITVFQGTVRATNTQGTVLVGAGQQAVAVGGQPPQLQLIVRPRDAVQWAMYYEPVLPSDSFEQLASIPEAARDAAFFVRRASLALGVGQIEAARSDLERAQQLDPSNGDTYALRAIVAVALDDRQAALDNGRTAVERAPRSSAARLALSYALQANFDIEAASEAVTRAVESEPSNGAAWARLAELRLALDDVSGAAKAAARAASVSPESARAQTVLGFMSLARMNLSDARKAFEEAVRLESDNPLARFGLGLEKIRRGRLADGRRDLEVAAALSPNSSYIRSYLGKAYFDEKRESLASEQFDLAKDLDQSDPTPWTYEAIQKQGLNRPVEALRDVEKSVELNDNRAVYRSRFLLDADLAARGARLGRIYRDLGFEQLALEQGWKSLADDPTNYSAHRLLADDYLVLPRHAIARDSELLQAQLLQPLNINPVQPRLADNGLSFLDDTGVAGVGFNEFTRLFAANQVSILADGVGGGQGTRTDNLILSGIFNRFSYSLGQFHFNTDGVRANDDLHENIYDAFLQTEITTATGAQVEIRRTDADNGDRRLLFDPNNFLPGLRNPRDTASFRLGGRHTFAPGSILIGSYVHLAANADFNTGVGLRVLTKDDANFFEGRYLHRWRQLNVTAGGGRYDDNRIETRTFGPRQFPPTTTDIRHTNGYLYATLSLPRPLSVSGGLSADDFESGLNRKQLNPKFGVTWALNSATTVRGAVFRVLERTLISSQTIEPTQVAGFNQFFYDANATDSWRYGLAVDRTLRPAVYAGVEVSVRDLTTPSRVAATGAVSETQSKERLGRAYLYAAPTTWLATSATYQLERFVGDPSGNNQYLLAEVTTHRGIADVRVFSRSGAFGRFRATVVDQDGRFQNPSQAVVPGADRFWTADASFGFRLPRQLGVVAVEAHNLLNKAFNFQDSTPNQPTILPKRLVSARVTLAF